MQPEHVALWHTVFAKNDQVVYRKIADETLLVPIRGKLADMQRIFALNPVAEYIWDQLDGKHCVQDIRDLLLAEFDVEPAQAEADLLDFLDELQHAALILRVT
jgi:hypothetical protein